MMRRLRGFFFFFFLFGSHAEYSRWFACTCVTSLLQLELHCTRAAPEMHTHKMHPRVDTAVEPRVPASPANLRPR